MKISVWRPSPVARRRMLRYGALCLALGGTGFLGWALGTCQGTAGATPVAASAPRPAEPSEVSPSPGAEPAAKAEPAKDLPPATPLKTEDKASTGGKTPGLAGKGASPADSTAKAPATTAAGPRPKGTRGADAVVRWNTPLAEGLELLEAGSPEAALKWVQALPGAEQPARVLEARALLALGRYPEARERFEALAGEAGCAADAAFGAALCQAQGKAGDIPDETLKQVAKLSAESWGAGRAAFEAAQRLPLAKKAGREFDEPARQLYQAALFSGQLEAPLEKECLDKLNELTRQMVLNPKFACSAPKATLHKVAPGESLTGLGKQYDVNIGRICRLNGLSAKGVLVAGRTVKVLQGDALVKVDRWRLTATLLIDGAFIRRYPVGLGPDDKTPRGTFTIRKKVVNPDWYYEGKRIPAGNPENILGTRWLGFDTEENGGRGAGLGLHGTTLPESVPGRESKGCIRMLNADVEELYDLVPQGTVVEIN